MFPLAKWIGKEENTCGNLLPVKTNSSAQFGWKMHCSWALELKPTQKIKIYFQIYVLFIFSNFLTDKFFKLCFSLCIRSWTGSKKENSLFPSSKETKTGKYLPMLFLWIFFFFSSKLLPFLLQIRVLSLRLNLSSHLDKQLSRFTSGIWERRLQSNQC